MGICCMSQGIQTGTLYQPRGVGWRGRWQGRGSRGRGHMYPCGWFMLMFDRKQQNSVKQLFFNLKKKKERIHDVRLSYSENDQPSVSISGWSMTGSIGRSASLPASCGCHATGPSADTVELYCTLQHDPRRFLGTSKLKKRQPKNELAQWPETHNLWAVLKKEVAKMALVPVEAFGLG